MPRKKTSAKIGTEVGKLTLKEIDSEIARLQQQAALIRETEKAEVIGRIKEAILYYGITAGELGLAVQPGKKRKPSVAKPTSSPSPVTTVKATDEAPQAKSDAYKRPAGRIKYQDGAGNTWSGFGPKPKWFVQALAEGKTEADLLA